MNKSGCTVSVIVPVYNVAPYLREALDSLINQTYRNLEIILIDDGSTDGSGDICDQYLSDPRVRVVHQENQGLSGARNTGLELISGEYVAFLDADDAYAPEMIELMLDGMLMNDVQLVVCGYEVYRTDGKMDRLTGHGESYFSFSKEEILDHKEAQKWVLTYKMPVTVWNKLYQKELWNQIRFPEGHVYEDMFVMFLLLDQCRHVLTLPDSYVYYRKRDGCISETDTIENIQDRLLAEHQMMDYIENHVPEVFSEHDFFTFRQRMAREISIRYSAFLSQNSDPEVLSIIKNETLNRWNSLEGHSLSINSHVVRFLFYYYPGMIVPIHSFWRKIKQIAVKE